MHAENALGVGRKRWPILALGLTVVGCGRGTGPAAQPVAPQSQQKPAPAPVDVSALAKRELGSPLGRHTVRGPKGEFHAEVEAKSAPKVTRDGDALVFSADLGTQVPLACTVFPTDIQPGATLSGILERATRKVRLEKLGIEQGGLIAKLPAIYLSLIYTVEQKGQRALGLLKLFVLSGLDCAVICNHDEVGYSESFARITRHLAETLKCPTEFGQPLAAEIHAFKLNDMVIGFGQDWTFRAKDGGFVAISKSTQLIPVTPTQLRSSDKTNVTTLNQDGRIVRDVFHYHEGSQPELELTLQRTKGRQYRYQGTMQGKPIQGEFSAKEAAGLAGEMISIRERKRALTAKTKQKLTREEYHPGVDPTKPDTVTYDLDPVTRRTVMKLGNMQIEATVDAEGRMVDGTMQVGANRVQIQRLHVEGKL